MSKLQEIAALGGVVQPPQKVHVDPRKDQKQIVTWHHKAVKAALKALAAEHDKSIQKLMSEALNLLFIQYGKGPIA